MKALWERLKNEPVLILNLINAVIAGAIAFGLDLTMEQKAGLIAISTAVLNLLARSQVTPVRKIK